MKQFATIRISQAAAKYSEQAPLTAVCCNACRTCVQTNLLTLALAALGGAGLTVRRLFRR
jgi:hypothetical protein